MTMEQLLISSQQLAEHSAAGYFLVSVLFKSSLILLVAGFVNFAWRQLSASNRSLLWLTTVLAVLALPVFVWSLPPLEISIPLASNFSTAPASSWMSEFPFNLFLLQILAGVYIVGVLLVLAYQIPGYIQLYSITAGSVMVEGSRPATLLNELIAVHGVSAPVELRISDSIQTPFTWGFRRHRILLPKIARDWDTGLLRQVLSHELGHVQRRDWLFHQLARLALTIYWINPLVWMAVHSLQLESEKACDDVAIDDDGCSLSYAENLLALARGIFASPVAQGSGLLSHTSELTHRLRHILSGNRDRGFLRADEISVVIVIALLACLPIMLLRFNLVPFLPVALTESTIPLRFTASMLPAIHIDSSGVLPESDDQDDFSKNEAPTAPLIAAIQYPFHNPHRNTQTQRVTVFPVAAPAKAQQQINHVPGHDLSLAINREVMSDIWEPAPLLTPIPVYPLQARRNGVEGYVTAEIIIDTRGHVINTTIVDSDPIGAFEKAVVEAVSDYRYCPELFIGDRTKHRTLQMKFSFSLQDAP